MIGDHIRTLRDGRWTHAIDCGDETVIVLAEDAAQPPRIRRSYRPEFVAGAEAVEVVRHRERTFPADEVVARAYSRVSDPALAAMFRDSEAFAEWCTTGRLPPAASNVAVAVPGGAASAGAPSPPREAKPGRAASARKNAKPARAAKAAPKARPARKAKTARAPAKAGRARTSRAAKAARRGGAKKRR